MDAQTRALTAINTDDILEAFGARVPRRAPRWLRLMVQRPALLFAREMSAFDDAVGTCGTREAALSVLPSFVREITVTGVNAIPPSGPVLLLSNHPGMTDTLALVATIPRTDLLVLAADRPFLRALPFVARSLIFIRDGKDKRTAALRRAVSHVSSGGALLTFPAGEIEPDPAVLPDAERALDAWSASSLLFARLVRDAVLVPVVVSGVLARPAQRSLLRLVRKERADRERLAAILQVAAHTLLPRLWPVHVRVDFLRPFGLRELAARGPAALSLLTKTVTEGLRRRARA